MASKNTDNPRERVTANILHSRWKRVAKLLAVIIVFCTTYALILPAITMTSQDAKCGYEEHVHEGECFDAEGNLICPLAEHEHTLACYADLAADIEAPAAWTADIPAVTGDRAYDVCNVANSQIGYRESDKNYLVSDGNQTQGYSRYGDWYSEMVDGSGARLENGISSYAYEDWDAMFASFVLYHAGIDDLGFDKDAGNWAGALAAAGKYADAADYSPEPGDLVFFTPKAGDYIHVGIVTDVNKGFLGLGIFGDDLKSLSVILGNSNNAVEEIRVSVKNRKEGDVAFETIHGYGILNPKKAEAQDVSAAEPVKDNSSANAAPEVVPADDGTANQAENDLDIQAAENASANAEDTANADSSLPIVLEPTSIPMDAVAEPNDSKDQALEGADAPANANEDAVAKASEDVAGADALTIENADATQDEAATAAPQDGAIAEAEIPAEWTQLEDGTYVDEDGNPVVPAVEDEQNPEIGAADNADPADAPQADTEEITGGALLEEIAGLSADSHIIGMGEEDLDSTEEAADSDVVVTVADAGISEDGTTINMAWNAVAQLPEATLPAGAIIRVDTATGKSHGMTAEAVQAWGGAATIGGEEIAFVGNEAYEVTFIGDNGLLYTWDDVQAISDASTVTFVGIHVKTLTDVEAADGTIALAFATTAKASDANAGQNYYVTKVSVNGSTGSATYTYENGVAMPADQDRVLQDAGLDVVPEKTLTASGPDYTVTMTYGEDAGIPDVAKLMVREIVSGTEEYENYIAEAKRALGISSDAEISLSGRFFDIKIMTKEGEFEPNAKVKVDIQYDEAEADVQIDNVNMVHISDEGSEQIDSVVKGNGDELSGVKFEAESFSVYGVVYTVDFIYNGYTYYLDGDHQILLSELLPILGIEESVSEIKNVSTELIAQKDEAVSDNEFYVEKTDNDWLLKSDVPFGNIYTLSIELDGRIYAITVKDVQESTDLTNFLDNITIVGAVQQGDGSYQVQKDTNYNLIAVFSEDMDYQFKNDATLTYQMPQGVSIVGAQSGSLTINVVYKGRTYQVDATYALTTDGKLSINFDQNDPDYVKLEQATNVSFRFSYYAQFDGSKMHLDFGSGVERTIVFEEPKPGDVYVSKQGSYDGDTGTFTYTIKVHANGDVTDVNVKDQIVGDALIFNNDVRVSPSVQYTNNGSSNGFDYTFPSMSEGQEITITYTARVNFTKDADKDGIITRDQTKNTVVAKPKGGEPRYSEYGHEIKYKSADKNDGTVIRTEANGDKIVKWTIEYNKERVVSAAGDLITDTISADSREYMKYHGANPDVKVYDENNNLVRTDRNVQLENKTDYTWTYKIPQSDAGHKYKYVITYETIVDIEKVNEKGVQVTLKNDANGDQGSVSIEPDNAVTINKSVESQSETQINWKVVIHVPPAGLSAAVLTDTLPHVHTNTFKSSHAESKYIFEELIRGSISYEGLIDGETAGDPDISDLDNTSGNAYFKITFYKDPGKQQPGLRSSAEGHDVIIRYSTVVDPEWLAENYAYPANDSTREHKNTADINGKPSTASAQFAKTGFEKIGSVYNTENTPTDYPVYVWGNYTFLKYVLWITKPGMDSFTIEDKFDTSILKVADPELVKGGAANLYRHMYICGGDRPGQVFENETKTPISYTETPEGVTLNVASIPKHEDGSYYRHYRIIYFLQVRDGVDLEALAKANGGDYSVENTAKWGDYESEFSFKVKTNYIDKQLLNESELGGTNRIAKYQIVFNPEKLMLQPDDETSDTITMTDTLSNTLSIDYGSIKIETDPANVPVPYSLKGDRETHETIATYQIPNATKVTITYEALVVGNGPVTIKNRASTSNRIVDTTSSKEYGSESEGEGAVANLKIVKVDGYDASKKLEGVRFKFYSQRRLPFDHDGNVTELILETDENGEIIIDGNEYLIYFGEKYFLEEIEAKPGYGTISFPYQYTIVNDMALVDYNNYVFFFNDNHQIKNWPLEGLVVEKQVESSDEQDLNKYFDFRVTVLNEDGTVNTDYNTQNSDYEFVNGVCEFQLKNKEQLMFWDFAVGTRYLVEEIGADGYAKAITYTVYNSEGEAQEVKTDIADSHTGVLTQPEELIVFKNSTSGSLKLKKKVAVNGTEVASITDDTFKKAVDGTYTFNIYAPSNAGGTSGDSGDGQGSATGDNTTQWNTTPAKTISITIKDGVINKVEPENDSSISIGTDGFVEISNLPIGDYKIVEDAPTNGAGLFNVAGGKERSAEDGYIIVTVETGKSGDEVADAGKAEFTNNINVGKLKLKKAVTEGSSTTDEFTFKVTLTAPEGSALAATYPAVHTGNSSLTEVSVANLASTGITLKANEELTISNLPEGTTYAVTEDAKDGWVNIGTVYSNTNTAKAITKNVTDEVTITNRQNGALKLKKEATVNGEVVANSSIKYLAKGSYTFTVSTDPASENAVTKTVVVTFDENGQASATLDGSAVTLADGFVVIPNLVPGKYNITENAPVNGTSLVGISGTGTSISGDTTQVEVKPGDTAAAQANATFTNNIDTGNLELTKTVSGTTDADTAFEFKIHLEPPQGVVLAATYPATLTGDDSVTTVSVVNGVITQSLKHGQTLKVNNLPAGTKYYITEEDYTSSGFVQGSTSNIGSADQEVTIPARSEGQVQTVQAQVENKFQAEGETDFKVRKTFTNGNLANHVFTFKLTQVTGENSTTQVQDNIKLASPVTVSTNATTGGTQQTLAFPLPDNFKFNQDDIGKTYWFLIEELVADSVTLDANGIDQANNIQYATVRQKWVSVAVTKNGKDLVVTKSTAAEAAADAEFTNEQLGKIEVEKIAQKAGVQDTADKTVFYFGLSSNGETFTRVANTSNVAVTSNEAAKTGWTNLPIGTYYVFEMQGETSNVPAGSRIGDYTVVNGKSTVALTAETLSEKATITNNKELVDISATKTWKNSDGADITDKIANASISFTLKQSLDDGSTWTEVENLTEVANTHTANVTIKLEGTASTDKSAWTVDWTNLPKYVNGQLVKYQVVETLITPADATAQGETTAMATFEPVTDKNDLANVSFTNQLPPTSLEGTKTWVDTKETHEPPTLTLTRKSAKEGSVQETVKASDGQSNLQPAWDGNNYKYSNLPKYDDAGYAYTYEVAEASFTVGGVTYTAVKKADGTYTVTTDSSSASAYTTVQNGNNFTNEEQTNFDFTKVWTTGGSENKDTWHDGQTIKVVLGRKLIPEGETEGVADAAFAAVYELTANAIASADSRYPITGVPNGTDYKFVISSLPTFGTMEIEGAAKSGRWEYFISEQRDGDNYNVYYYEAGAQAENHTEESVKTGGTIQNDLKTYEFPHTGSIGIMPFMMGGSLISAIALIGVSILTWMERRRNG
ncbi:MAG: SpaA isopeptide-forming pilin-related protein [Lachnospiraceae bacterium]|nr:SpaA isopeptide-forming pilin-related protein [Lachnospiraceae bacterium]